jgi:hypothetical protein
VGVRAAVGLFFTLRLASALLVRRHPDPLELVPAPVASRAALRSMTLALEACGLLSFSALLGACAACAAAELGARALLTSLAQLALWLASDEVALGTRLETLRVSVVAEEAWRRPLRTSRALAEGASALGALVMQRLRSLSAAANRTGDANRTDSAAAAGVDGIGVIASTSASAANASASAANASANALHAVRSEAHGSAVADAAALPDADAAVDAPTPMHASAKGPPAEGEHGWMAEGEHGWMARARRLWPLDGKGARETAASDEAAAASAASAADAAADAAAASAATLGVGAVPIWWADPPSTTAWELRLLTRRAATQAVAHVLLALAATLWASEAAFVCLLALTQRLRLLVLLVLNRMRQKVARAEPSMKEMLSSLPRTTEELTTQVNYQLNLIGLQTEQWMTDTWAAYLRQRQQWMRGAQSKPTKKSAPKGAKGASGGGGGGGGGEGLANALSNWIDERVVTTKSQWVSFQLERSRKQGPKKPATAGNEGDGAAALPAERLGVAPWRPVSRSTFTTPAAAATERKSPASDGASEKHVVSGSTSTHQQPQHDATSAPWWQRSWWGPQQSAAGSGVDGKVQI